MVKISGTRFRKFVERLVPAEMAKSTEPEFLDKNLHGLFQPKGQMTLEQLLFQSVIGPIGLPASEALYPTVSTTDGKPRNAMNDYAIRMSADAVPSARAFWSVTLYDTR